MRSATIWPVLSAKLIHNLHETTSSMDVMFHHYSASSISTEHVEMIQYITNLTKRYFFRFLDVQLRRL